MEELTKSNTDTANPATDGFHVVVNLDQNVIAVCTETGEIKKHENSNNNIHGHFLRKHGAAKRKRLYEDSSIWLYDAQEEDFEDEEFRSEHVKVVECERSRKCKNDDKVKDRYEKDEKMSFDHGKTEEGIV